MIPQQHLFGANPTHHQQQPLYSPAMQKPLDSPAMQKPLDSPAMQKPLDSPAMQCAYASLIPSACSSSSSTAATGMATPTVYATDSSSSVASINGGGGGKRSKLLQCTKEEEELCKALLQLNLEDEGIPASRWTRLAELITLNSTGVQYSGQCDGVQYSGQCGGGVMVGGSVEEKLKLQYEGVKGLRTMLSVVGSIPIQDVVDSGVVPALTAILESGSGEYSLGGSQGSGKENFMDSNSSGGNVLERAVQFEAAWVLTNIASGSSAQTEAVVVAGGLEQLVALLEAHQSVSPDTQQYSTEQHEELSEQAIWGIGNIGGDRTAYRDCILKRRTATDAILQACTQARKLETVRTGVWCMSNLCRGKPRPPYCSAIKSFVPFLRNCLLLSSDSGVLTDAAWAFEGIADSPAGLRATVACGIVPRLIQLLSHDNTNVVRPALRVLGQLATGNAEETQAVVDAGAIPVLASMLTSPVQYLRKDASWTVSNIAAGTPEQLQALIDGEVFAAMGRVFSHDEDSSIRMEAAWAFVNAATTTNPRQLEALLGCGCMQAVFATVANQTGTESIKILSVALTALESMLKFGAAKSLELGLHANVITAALLDLGIVPRLLELQRLAEACNRYPLWDKTAQILNTYLLVHH